MWSPSWTGSVARSRRDRAPSPERVNDRAIATPRPRLVASLSSVLRGREREQATLRELFDHARAGHGSALLLRGQPGVGKSALLEDAVTAAGDLTVLRTRGVESEA